MSAAEHNPPNLSQFMTGFDVKQPLSATTLQDPGEYNSAIVPRQDEIISPFVSSASCLYLLKILRFSDVFRG